MKEEILDRYARQELTSDDKLWLKQTLAEDPNLQQELDLYRDIVRGMDLYSHKTTRKTIQKVDAALEQEGFFEDRPKNALEGKLIENIKILGKEDLMQTIQNVDATLEQEGFFEQPAQTTKTPIFSLVKITIAAASILLVLTLSWQYLNPSIAPAEQYAALFEPCENTLSHAVKMELSEQGFGGNPEVASLEQLVTAMDFYDAKEYDKASQALVNLQQQGIDPAYQHQAQLYLALSYMAEEQLPSALPILKELANSNGLQKETATWYLALIHLKQENLGLAKEQLETIQASTIYKEKATQLLQQL